MSGGGREKVSHEGKQKGQLSWNPLICDRLIPIQESVRNGTQCALELLKFDVLKFHNSNEYREMVVTKSQHTVKSYDSNLKSITFDTGYRCCNIFFFNNTMLLI